RILRYKAHGSESKKTARVVSLPSKKVGSSIRVNQLFHSIKDCFFEFVLLKSRQKKNRTKKKKLTILFKKYIRIILALSRMFFPGSVFFVVLCSSYLFLSASKYAMIVQTNYVKNSANKK